VTNNQVHSRRLILSLGSAAASAFNFYTYVFLPSLIGTASLEHFVKANYLGGLYLFGIGSSVSPIAIFVLAAGKRSALSKYVAVSVLGLVVILSGGWWLVMPPWSYFCLLGAICMHVNGFFYASLIREQRLIAASGAQIIQPLSFAAAISLRTLHIAIAADWSVLYLISAVLGLAFFLMIVNVGRIKQTLSLPASEKIGWTGILSRVGFCVSFPVFFQLELILCGHWSTVNVGVYAMLQKLYASISISLFGAIGVHLLSKHLDERSGRGRLLDRESVWLAAVSAACTPLVGFAVLFFTHGGKGLNGPLIIGGAGVSFLFTVCSFVGLRLSALRPVLGLEFFAASLLLYMLGFAILRPATAGGFLGLAAVFFGAFLCCAVCSDLFGLSERGLPGVQKGLFWRTPQNDIVDTEL
jgi:hypothetical protein